MTDGLLQQVIEHLDERFAQHQKANAREFQMIQEAFGEVRTAIAGHVTEQIGDIAKQVSGLTERVDGLTEQVGGLRGEMTRRFDRFEDTLARALRTRAQDASRRGKQRE